MTKGKAEGLNVEFKGSYSQADLPKVNQEIDVGIIPSIWEEILPLVGLEYFNSRIPIVGSRIGGIQDFIQDGVTRFLFEPRNPKDLADKMRHFINTPLLIREMQKKFKHWKSMDEHAKEMIIIYKSLPAKEKE